MRQLTFGLQRKWLFLVDDAPFCFITVPSALTHHFGVAPSHKHRPCLPIWECIQCFIKATGWHWIFDSSGLHIIDGSGWLPTTMGTTVMSYECSCKTLAMGLSAGLCAYAYAWKCHTSSLWAQNDRGRALSCAAQTRVCQAEAGHHLGACWKWDSQAHYILTHHNLHF